MSEVVTDCTCGQLAELEAAAREVIARWDSGDLAGAVRDLAAVLDDGDPEARGCEACGAEAGEVCRPGCIGQAAELDARDALGELVQDVRAALDGDGDLIRAAQALADAVWPEAD